MKTISLHADGFEARFEFSRLEEDIVQTRYDAQVSVSTGTVDRAYEFESLPTFVSRHDLERLSAYFDDHLAGDLSTDASLEYVPLEFGFKLQLLSGAWDVPAVDGEFGIRLLVGAGRKTPAAGHHVFVGVASGIEVSAARAFVAELKAWLEDCV